MLAVSFRILDRSSTLTLGRSDLAHLLIATLRDSRVQIVSQNIQNVISNTMRLGDLDGSGRLDFHEYTIMLQNPGNRYVIATCPTHSLPESQYVDFLFVPSTHCRGFLDRYFNISFTKMFQYLS